MSLFQCEKCGCIENTACSDMGNCWYPMNHDFEKGPDVRGYAALLSYKEQLGLRPDQPFGPTCSACSPVWYDERGQYGVGPNPNPTAGRGLWHGQFRRQYLAPGQFETDHNTGNLRHRQTGAPATKADVLKEDPWVPAPDET